MTASPTLQIPMSPRKIARFWRSPLALLGLFLLALLIFAFIFAPQIAPHLPKASVSGGLNAIGEPHAPGAGFLLGADSLGRDLWSRLIYGTRISLVIAITAMISSTLIGTTIGLVAGFFGGRVDSFLTRLTEIIVCLPTILLAITLRVVLPDSLADIPIFKAANIDPRLMIAIGLVTWTGLSRAVRAQVRSLREREFVEAARALGVSNVGILIRHLLPNVLPTVLALATLATANNILLEAGLSYLGLGDPAAPSWGSMIAEGQPYFTTAPWIALAPGVAIVVAVVAFNLIGNALSEELEPRR